MLLQPEQLTGNSSFSTTAKKLSTQTQANFSFCTRLIFTVKVSLETRKYYYPQVFDFPSLKCPEKHQHGSLHIQIHNNHETSQAGVSRNGKNKFVVLDEIRCPNSR